MKDLRELRYPTQEEMQQALEASEKGPEAVLEFLRKGRAGEDGGGVAGSEEKPETD